MTDVVSRDERDPARALERVVVGGDLSKLSPAERLWYYEQTCRSLGLNSLTRPFDYLTLSNRLVLYAKRDATDQLRKLHTISITITSQQQVGDLYVVAVRATTQDGRSDEDLGVVTTANTKGDTLANAIMKSVTKAKRRVTLSICGLGMLDETEVEAVPGARHVVVNADTGEIIGDEQAALPPAAEVSAEEQPAQPGLMRTDQQVTAITRLASKLGWDADQFYAWLKKEYGAANPDVLTFVQASRAIADLQRRPAAGG